MSYVYGRRYNNHYGKNNNFSSKAGNIIIGTTLNSFQPRATYNNNQNLYYSTKKISQTRKTPYNRPAFNYGNLYTTTKYKSVNKNGIDPLISNSYNIINNFNSKKMPQSNKTIYNKRLNINNDNINNLLDYENKKKEKEQFYFSNKNNNYNND